MFRYSKGDLPFNMNEPIVPRVTNPELSNCTSQLDLTKFSDFPDETRLWVYGFEHPLDSYRTRIVCQELKTFLPTWVSHGTPVRGAFEVLFDRFILLAGYCSQGISGCSIDSSIRKIKGLSRYQLDALNRSLLFYRDREGKIQSSDRAFFQARVRSGTVTPATMVFDTTLQSLGQLRAGRFETVFKDCWHARAFPVPS